MWCVEGRKEGKTGEENFGVAFQYSMERCTPNETYVQVEVGRRDQSSKTKAITLLLGPGSALVVQRVVDQANTTLVDYDGLKRRHLLGNLQVKNVVYVSMWSRAAKVWCGVLGRKSGISNVHRRSMTLRPSSPQQHCCEQLYLSCCWPCGQQSDVFGTALQRELTVF